MLGASIYLKVRKARRQFSSPAALTIRTVTMNSKRNVSAHDDEKKKHVDLAKHLLCCTFSCPQFSSIAAGGNALIHRSEATTMKKFVVIAALAAVLIASTGCANGAFRRMWQGNSCDSCNPPANQPPFGYGASYAPSCPQCQGGQDYFTGSSIGGATLNPPVSDAYGTGVIGGTIVPPATVQTLPGPQN